MRLICGILHLDGGAASETTLRRMAAAMTAPGLAPAVTCRLDGAVGLATLDFSGASSRLTDQGGWMIAADLRLDHPAAKPEAVLLEAAQRHGADFPDHLRGDFAVALWRREAGELWLGRDFIGVRPLAWTWQSGRWFAFASLPKGLHGAGLAAPDLDRAALAAKFCQTYFAGSDSGFKHIAYLQAGHSLRVQMRDSSPPRPHRAYRPDPAQVGSWRGTAGQAAETLRHLVQEAVAARLPASGPVASHLTGGLDSSAITVLVARAARRRDERVLALSMMAPRAIGPAEQDERPPIAAVLSQEPDISHLAVHDLPPQPDRLEDADWPGSVIGGADDAMMAAAAAFGADTILSGVGGDEGASYNGANLYASLLRAGRLPSLWRELPTRARNDGVALSTAIRNRLISPLVPDVLRRRRRIGVMDSQHGAVRYLSPQIRDSVAQRRMPPVLHSNSPADRTRAFADHHIPSRCTYYAIMAARHGLVASFPLLDRRIVDFMLSLPIQLFLADGQSRQPFRRAMLGILPETVRLARHKLGLFDHRFIEYANCRADFLARLDTMRNDPCPLVQEIFDLEAIRAGLELLPQPDQVSRFIRTQPGVLFAGNPIWVMVFAVECLSAAWQLYQMQDSEG